MYKSVILCCLLFGVAAASQIHQPSYFSHIPWIWKSTVEVKRVELPLVMSQWSISMNATKQSYNMISEEGADLLDAVEKSLTDNCELSFCSQGVGPYWKIDEQGDISQDAMLMDGDTYDIGAVANLRHVRNAIGVARAVMKYTKSTLITGDQATDFAVQMGFPFENIRSNETEERWQQWKDNNCQPNFRANVVPDPSSSCGPYSPESDASIKAHRQKRRSYIDPSHVTGEPDHDTICQIAISGADTPRVVVGTTTNGLDRKIPGRVGDTPIPGAGGFADSEVGAATATGNGDIMMRTLPSYQAVEEMRNGLSPQQASRAAILKILRFFPTFSGAVMAASVDGTYGAACTGYSDFPYTVQTADMGDAELITIDCAESLHAQEATHNTGTTKTTTITLFVFSAFLTLSSML